MAPAARSAVHVRLGWLLVFALFFNAVLFAAKAGADAGRMQAAAAAQEFAEAGALCAHSVAQDDAGGADRHDSGEPCCDHCLACQWDASALGIAPEPAAFVRHDPFRVFVLAPPRSEVIGQPAFKRGPPPRAPPHLLETAQAA